MSVFKKPGVYWINSHRQVLWAGFSGREGV